MIDIVLPDKNEESLIKIAKKLGYSSICLSYKDLNEQKHTMEDKIKINYALINPQNIEKARKKADIIIGKGDAKNLIENSKIDIYLFDEKTILNHTICRTASEKNKMIGFPFSIILESKSRTQILSKISKAIALCQKYNVKMAFFSFASNPLHMRNPRDLMSLFLLLGMKNPRDAIRNMEERIERNIKIREGKLLAEGIEIVE